MRLGYTRRRRHYCRRRHRRRRYHHVAACGRLCVSVSLVSLSFAIRGCARKAHHPTTAHFGRFESPARPRGFDLASPAQPRCLSHPAGGIIPDPYGPKLADMPHFFQGNPQDFRKTRALGMPPRSAAKATSFKGLEQRFHAICLFRPDFQDGVAARLQDRRQQPGQRPVGVQAIRAAIQGCPRLVAGHIRVQ